MLVGVLYTPKKSGWFSRKSRTNEFQQFSSHANDGKDSKIYSFAF